MKSFIVEYIIYYTILLLKFSFFDKKIISKNNIKTNYNYTYTHVLYLKKETERRKRTKIKKKKKRKKKGNV